MIVPFSVIGPFVGVFIDRWSRRRIMDVAPCCGRRRCSWCSSNPTRRPPCTTAGALFVTSVNRFFLATAQAVVPRLVPTEDLLAANSIATVGGTVALLAGVFAGGIVADAFGTMAIVSLAAAMWVAASMLARSIRSDLRPLQLPESPELLRHQVRRVGVEFARGLRHIVRTPRAVGPITSIGLDQFGQGLILVLALVVFRERFEQGVGSFSWLIGAGGMGVFAGLATVGALDRRFPRERIIAGAFAVGGAAILAGEPARHDPGPCCSRASPWASRSRGRRCRSTRWCRKPCPTGCAGACSRPTTSSTTWRG